jgi:hypothetical protein
MAKKRLVSESDQFVLRLPPGLRGKLARLAKANARSANSEIVARLERSLIETTTVRRLEEQVELLWDAIGELQQSSHDHAGELRG